MYYPGDSRRGLLLTEPVSTSRQEVHTGWQQDQGRLPFDTVLKDYSIQTYGPLIQDNQGEPVPETIGHVNLRYHHYPPQYL